VNRRSFISLALLSPFIRAIKPKDLFFDEIKLKGAPVVANQCWCKERIDYIAQDAFYGIPYNLTDATISVWSGFKRN
jgi:hypothetical protein